MHIVYFSMEGIKIIQCKMYVMTIQFSNHLISCRGNMVMVFLVASITFQDAFMVHSAHAALTHKHMLRSEVKNAAFSTSSTHTQSGTIVRTLVKSQAILLQIWSTVPFQYSVIHVLHAKMQVMHNTNKN